MRKEAIRLPNLRTMRRLGLRLSGLLSGRASSQRWAAEGMRRAGTAVAKTVMKPVSYSGDALRRNLVRRGFTRTGNTVGGISDFLGGTGKFEAVNGIRNSFLTQGLPNMVGRAGSFVGQGTTTMLPLTTFGAMTYPAVKAYRAVTGEKEAMEKEAALLPTLLAGGKHAWRFLSGGSRAGRYLARGAGNLAQKGTLKATGGLARKLQAAANRNPGGYAQLGADFLKGTGRFAADPSRRIQGVLTGGLGGLANRTTRMGVTAGAASVPWMALDHMLEAPMNDAIDEYAPEYGEYM